MNKNDEYTNHANQRKNRKRRKRKSAPRRNVRDRLFRYIFENDRKALLQLYNALNHTDYRDPGELTIMTVESVIYLSMKNDLAFTVAGCLNLYEQQSSFNPNMPVRFLIYLAEEYQRIIESSGLEKLYGSKLIKLPTPKCAVFYNGTRDEPEERELLLSEAYEQPDRNPSVELRVWVLNINYGCNEDLMKKCHKLWEYSFFVNLFNDGIKNGLGVKASAEQAIEKSLKRDVLTEILTRSRMEVIGMLLSEFDEKKYWKYIRSEGREEGLEYGRKEGIRILIVSYQQAGLSYEETLRQIIEMYSLNREEALAYMEKHWQKN